MLFPGEPVPGEPVPGVPIIRKRGKIMAFESNDARWEEAKTFLRRFCFISIGTSIGLIGWLFLALQSLK